MNLADEVAEANPIKQGLKLQKEPERRVRITVAEANPIKQGLKLRYNIIRQICIS